MTNEELIEAYKRRHKLVAAVYVIFRKPEGKICLSKRANTGWMDGYYSLPSGHLDGNESLVSAAIREANEEVGVSLKPQNLKLQHVIHRKSTDPVTHERLDFYFETTVWQGELVNAEPHKCDELKWVNPIDLPANMVPEVNQALQMIARGEPYSDLGFS